MQLFVLNVCQIWGFFRKLGIFGSKAGKVLSFPKSLGPFDLKLLYFTSVDVLLLLTLWRSLKSGCFTLAFVDQHQHLTSVNELHHVVLRGGLDVEVLLSSSWWTFFLMNSLSFDDVINVFGWAAAAGCDVECPAWWATSRWATHCPSHLVDDVACIIELNLDSHCRWLVA